MPRRKRMEDCKECACIPGEYYGLTGEKDKDYTAQFADMAADASERQQPVLLKRGTYHTGEIPEKPNLHIQGARGGGHSFGTVIRPTGRLLNWRAGSGFRSSFRDLMVWPNFSAKPDYLVQLDGSIYHVDFEGCYFYKTDANKAVFQLNTCQAIKALNCLFWGDNTGSADMFEINDRAGLSLTNPNVESCLNAFRFNGGVVDMFSPHIERCGQWCFQFNNGAFEQTGINIVGGRLSSTPSGGVGRFVNSKRVNITNPSCNYGGNLKFHVSSATAVVDQTRMYGMSMEDVSSNYGPEKDIIFL